MLYGFGDFGLSPEGYALTRGGTRVPLEPRVLEVLTYLAANREQVVSKLQRSR
jgi:DNA-binding winged helix-turn-helix (wHTH) protein